MNLINGTHEHKNMIDFMFGIHNHQPIGNFDGVFKETYKDCYLPFIEILSRYPKVRVSLHYTGPLLEWISENHPEYFDKLRKLLERNQIEFMGGGFYEPLLPVIPRRDALGQIKLMQEYINEKFGVIPKGMWLAERVWEPGLPSLIAEAGLQYVTIDDTHFYYAGFKSSDMFGYYVTEDQGYTVNVFPIDKELRYRVPFRVAEETIEYLKSIKNGEGVTLADDGEKFGVWPGTYKWVYTDGYLERLFTLLTKNSDWINMMTFGEYIEKYPPKGRVYLPTASYDEMMEWSLPVESQSNFSNIVEEFKNTNQYNRMRPFLRGGFWRNFLVKYSESNKMYSKMMHVSNIIEKRSTMASPTQKPPAGAAKSPPEARVLAQKELYKGQCNCSYWHGLFGGLYLNYLRHAVYKHLIAAENIYGTDEILEKKDYNFDGHKEILFSSKDLNVYISPDKGGQIVELDYKPKEFNLSNVLTRRPEAYHHKIEQGGNPGTTAQPQSIHNINHVKEAGLLEVLSYDWYERNSLIDHFFDPSTTLRNFIECKYGENGDFVNQPYSILKCDNSIISLMRQGRVFIGGRENPLRITKLINLQAAQNARSASLNISYELHNTGSELLDIWFGIEFNLTLLAGNAKDRYYSDNEPLKIKKEIQDSSGIELIDKYTGFKVVLGWEKAGLLWRFPIETVSHSESGLERTYQGSCIMPSWKLNIGNGEKKNLGLMIQVKEI